MNTQQKVSDNLPLLVAVLFAILAFAAFLLMLVAYLRQRQETVLVTSPTSQTSPTPFKAPNATVSPTRPPDPIKPSIGPIRPITTPITAPVTAPPAPPPVKPTPLLPILLRPAPDESLNAYCNQVVAYLDQCRFMNKLLQHSPTLTDYKREHETATTLYIHIPEEVPAAIKPDQASIIKRTLADLDQLADIDEITIFQHDKCLLNAAGCEEEGNEKLAEKFRVVAGSCEEGLLKNIDHRKKLMGIVENALKESKPE